MLSLSSVGRHSAIWLSSFVRRPGWYLMNTFPSPYAPHPSTSPLLPPTATGSKGHPLPSHFLTMSHRSLVARRRRTSLPGNRGSSRKVRRGALRTGRRTLKIGRRMRTNSSRGSGFCHSTRLSGSSHPKTRCVYCSQPMMTTGRPRTSTISQVSTPWGSLGGLLNHAGRGLGGNDDGGV